MYLHLGEDVLVQTRDIIGIFDLDTCSTSIKTREFLASSEKKGAVVNVSFELPKSFIVAKQEKNTLYISQISPATLKKRHESQEYFK